MPLYIPIQYDPQRSGFTGGEDAQRNERIFPLAGKRGNEARTDEHHGKRVVDDGPEHEQYHGFSMMM